MKDATAVVILRQVHTAYLEFTLIAKDPELAKQCLNYAYVFHIIKLRRKSKVNRWYMSSDFKEAKDLLEKGCPVVNEEINMGKTGLKLYRGLVIPIAYYPFKADQSRTRTLSSSAPPPNCKIPSALPFLISSAPPTKEEKLSDFVVPTHSESLSSEDSSPEIPDIPDMTSEDDTEVIDDVTEVIDEDDEDASSINNKISSETAVTPSPVRTKVSHKRKRAGRCATPNPTENKPIKELAYGRHLF
ncbi:hypothetical protein K440DRAFT_635708 [Wilcoxina mikolae CBS 423.85]|nr:hypothetical protein K440DRAFT_635708 [Wilcoxina mikolae CBS 423.85]